MNNIFFIFWFVRNLTGVVGIKFNFVEHKLVTEGAAATGVMAVKDNMSKKLGKNIISLICGGNIDANLFNKIIA